GGYFCRVSQCLRAFRETAGTLSKPRRGGCPHPPGWGLFPSHVGAGALTRPGGDFFRAAEGNLLSHTCHSEECRDESLLSNTCHSESASAVRNLLFARVPILSRSLRKGGDFFRAVEQNLLSNTCHSESALAV